MQSELNPRTIRTYQSMMRELEDAARNARRAMTEGRCNSARNQFNEIKMRADMIARAITEDLEDACDPCPCGNGHEIREHGEV